MLLGTRPLSIFSRDWSLQILKQSRALTVALAVGAGGGSPLTEWRVLGMTMRRSGKWVGIRRGVRRGLTAVALAAAAICVPVSAYAQAAIAGVVRDNSGAVLPGVTVEASSPALIERVRSAVTDGAGQYRVENLRPGVYAIRFSLAGFSTVQREGVELSGSMTATVSVDMKVGALEETITVTGETPTVDVQNAQRQTVLTNEVINAIPTAGSYNSLLVLVPGLLGGQQDVSTGPCNSCTFSAHGTLLSGGRANSEARLMVDGISIAVPQAGGTNYLTDTRNAQEITFTTAGSLGEVESGGPVMNIVPRSGGNKLSGSGYAAYANDSTSGSNYSDALKAAGLTAPNPLIKAYDFSGATGFPIKVDRVWFFGTARSQGDKRYITNMYYNQNAGDPTKWLYVPDPTRQAFNDKTWQNASGRLTMQVSQRNKLNIFWDEQRVCQACENGGNYANAVTSPEANGYGDLTPMRFQEASWTNTFSNKVLIDGGFGYFFSRWGGRAKQDPNTESLVKVVEQCTGARKALNDPRPGPCPDNGNIPGLTYRSQTVDLFSDGRNKNITTTWRAGISFVTGSWTTKVGYYGNQLGDLRSANRGPNNLRYRVDNGIPNQLTEFINNFQNDLWMRDHALFVQEQWTLNRLTVQGALRFDHASSWAPAQQIGPERFMPNPLIFPRTPVVDSYKDFSPRMSVTYDLFGNGKTALKGSFGRYLESTITASNYSLANPTSRIVSNVSRPWTDANNNFTPDCNLLNPLAQDLRASGGDLCGVISDQRFGTAQFTNTIDPDILHGWGVRPSDKQFALGVQQEVLPRVSVDVGWIYRTFRGFTVTDNRLVGPENFTKFSVAAPSDPRLPGGGGYTVGDLYDLNNNALVGQVDNIITYADKYGKQYQRFSGWDISVNARPRNGLTMQGGISFGKSESDNCEVRAKVPEIAPLNAYCHIETGQLPQYKALGTYVIPKIDLQTSATFTSKPGIQVSGFGTPVAGGAFAANYTITSASLVPVLGRPLAGGAPNATINVLPPYAQIGDRVNELDLRIGKIIKVNRVRTNVGIDIYNVLNSDTALSYNQAFIVNGPWLTPTSIMSARFAKISAQIDF